MKIIKHKGVVCFCSTIKQFGTRLDVLNYATDGILIDTGPARFVRDFADFFQLQKVNLAVLTHHHEDHSGNAAWLEKRGIPVHIHAAGIPICRRPARLPLYRRICWRKREKFSPQPLPGVIEGRKMSWEVIRTPGHTPDHIALYGREMGAVFTGDLFVSPKIKLALKNENIPETIRSIKSLLAKDFDTLYCGHSGIIEDGRAKLEQKLEYLENLVGKVQELHRQGLSVRAINSRIYPKNSFIAFVSANEWSSENIIKSILRDK